MIKVTSKGDFHKTKRFLEHSYEYVKHLDLGKYGDAGVNALASHTPRDSGATANSWGYKIKRERGRITISFYNSNIQNGVPIAIILQYGHATRTGGYVEGRDYINPAIQPIFDQIANEAWQEVTR